MNNRDGEIKLEVCDKRRIPIKLSPVGKDYLWGGHRLKDDFFKDIDMDPLAETWECSTHSDGLSLVSSGDYEGKSLRECLCENPDWVGEHPRAIGFSEGRIPILVKLIDAKKDLSVQVHPDDDYAAMHEREQFGKTEGWYVIDALRGSSIAYGLCDDFSTGEIRRSIENGTLQTCLQSVPVHKNDFFFLKPGTIHAIGAGCLIAEVQGGSNLTYRLYDYDRVDKNGYRRELHIEKALEVADLKAASVPKQPKRTRMYYPGYTKELLCKCSYFQMERMIFNTEKAGVMVSIRTTELSFEVLLCVDGCGVIMCDEVGMSFVKGDCFFLPAVSEEVKIHGVGVFLLIRC